MQNVNGSKQNTILKGYNLLLYFAGSMIMYDPVEECVDDFLVNGIVKRLPVSSNNPRFVEAASNLRRSCENLKFCRVMLQDDYLRLFSSEGSMLAPPFKSFHNPADALGQSKRETVSDFYDSYGWKFRSRYNIKDDHLGIELLFLSLLIDKYIIMDDDACRIEMSNEIRRFITEHIFTWLPEWNNLVQEHSETFCYKGIASLIYASCEDIYMLLGSSASSLELNLPFKN